jgi:branched-chain amino acid aminotransferase
MYYNNKTLVFLNGQFVKATESVTDLYSQTLHYGYGAFEGIRAYEVNNTSVVFKGVEHYERLKKSCELVNIPFNYTIEELLAATQKVLELNSFTNAYIRPLVFCGPNMSLTGPKDVSILICAWEWGAYLGDNRLNLMISSYCRPHPRSTKIEAKICGHYVNSILATSEAKSLGFDEALLLDSEGFLAEGPGANLFFEKNGELFTPKTGNILPGITRATVVELCEELNIKLSEGSYTESDLFIADSAFYCGTAAEIIGIDSVNGNVFKKPWNDTLGRKIQQAYLNRVKMNNH